MKLWADDKYNVTHFINNDNVFVLSLLTIKIIKTFFKFIKPINWAQDVNKFKLKNESFEITKFNF